MLEDLREDIKIFLDKNPLAAECMIYGLYGQRSIIDAMAEATIYMQGKNREEGRISNIHWAIDYNFIKKHLPQMCWTAVKSIRERKADWLDILKQSYEFITKWRKEIEPENYCVYRQMKEFKKEYKDESFTIEQIMPANKDGKCDRQIIGFVCPHFGNAESCTCDKGRIECSLSTLKEQGLVEKDNNSWRMLQ